jgi:hypothetical protein
MHDRRKLMLSGLLLVLLALVLSTGWLIWQKRQPAVYGAIALSQNSLGFGTAWGYRDPASASERAQKECAHAGATDCVVRLSLAGTCGALAISGQSNQVVAVNDADKAMAGALALAQCQATGASDCVVQANFCGSGS